MSRALLRALGIALAGLTVIALAPLTARIFDDAYTPGVAALAALAVVAVAVVLPTARLWIRLPVQVAVVLAATALAVGDAGGTMPGGVLDALTSGIGEVLSARWPAPATPAAVGAVVALVAGLTAVAAELAHSARFTVGVLAPGVVLLLVIALLGAPSGVPAALALGLWCLLAVVTVAVLQHLRAQRSVLRPRFGGWIDVSGAAILGVVALVVPLLATAALTREDRYDPRADRTLDPTVIDTVSPLSLVAGERVRQPPVELFTASPGGLGRWRQVVLTRYDGRAWMPTGELLPPADELARVDDERERIAATLDIIDLDGSWVPMVDDVTSVSPSLRTDAPVDSLWLDGGLEPGTEVQLVVQPPAPPATSARDDAALSQPSPLVDVEPPTELTQLVAQATEGASSDYERAEAIARMLRTEYQLDPDAPAGQTIGQLTAFLTGTKRGSEEQFVAGFGLLAAIAELPVRIAVGWDSSGGGRVTTVRSSDMRAWAEVGFEGAGWVTFDPVPTDTAPPIPPEQGAAAAAPVPPQLTPDPPDTPDLATDDETPDEPVTTSDPSSSWWPWLLVAVAVPALLALYVVGVRAAKRRRWHARRRPHEPARSVSGAFLRASGVVVDLGGRFDTSETDLDNGRAAAAVVGPGSVATMERLAQRSTRAVYDGRPPSAGDEAAAWSDVDELEADLRQQVGRWRWWRARLSTRSLRTPAPRR